MRAPFVFLAVALAACTPSPPVGVVTATQDQVANCAYVKNISSTPGVFGPFAALGLEDARNGVLTSAAASGANTVVFDPVEPGERVFTVDAIAYRC